MIDDPLFQRLWIIKAEVESGRAGTKTLAEWEELCDGVQEMIDSLRSALLETPPLQREHAVRMWIQSFVNQHWPETTLH